MHPTGSVVWLRDRDGLFPLLQLEGDSDGATGGWLSFTSSKRSEVVLAQASWDEWNEGENGTERALERILKELGRNDIRAVTLLRVERPKQASGRSFQAFRAAQNQPRLVYRALEGAGEAQVESRQSLTAFQEAGGLVLVHPLAGGSGAGAA